MNEKFMKHSSVSRTNWKKLHQENDADINYDDISETDAKFWADAHVVMPKHKVHISVRLDEDIVDYFKEEGRGYQSRMNAVLRSYVNSHEKKKHASSR
ncbi:MAG: BrnA antitoxin family protein [Proteobacteria bacterium]|nr:BrnA antitoxin family protein [Pseudomonadota bacterium]